MKRLFDILFGTLFLLLALPFMAIVALIVCASLGRPLLFRQTRPGLYGSPFELLKFRTMSDERNDSGEIMPEPERLTNVGRMLRKYSLDELPELINVIKGDMSLVGPRPLLMEYLPLYNESQRRRHEVRPGLTGWAQVNGRNALSWEEKFELDVWYVDNKNLLVDIKIVFMTLMQLLRPQGVNAVYDTSMPRFRGTGR